VKRLRTAYEAMLGADAKMVALEPSQAGVASSWEVAVPVSRGSLSPKIKLRELSDEYLSARQLAHRTDTPVEALIEIALFTKDKAGQIAGDLGQGRVIRIDLIPTG